MKKIILFVLVSLAWPFLTIFVLSIEGNLTKEAYLGSFLNYSIVGMVSALFLVFILHHATSFRHKIYIYGGYIIFSPWVYIFFYYLNFWLHPILLTIISSCVPILGSFLGSKLGKNT